MPGTVKRRPIIAMCVAACAAAVLAPAPASAPGRTAPQRVEGGNRELYCLLAWIFLCHAQPNCTPSGCGRARLPGFQF
jgi:hypothetical protein